MKERKKGRTRGREVRRKEEENDGFTCGWCWWYWCWCKCWATTAASPWPPWSRFLSGLLDTYKIPDSLGSCWAIKAPIGSGQNDGGVSNFLIFSMGKYFSLGEHDDLTSLELNLVFGMETSTDLLLNGVLTTASARLCVDDTLSVRWTFCWTLFAFPCKLPVLGRLDVSLCLLLSAEVFLRENIAPLYPRTRKGR